jgi:hypothetical protein
MYVFLIVGRDYRHYSAIGENLLFSKITQSGPTIVIALGLREAEHRLGPR